MSPSEKQVAIVTGGGSGIGQALCEALGQRGVMVIAADINRDHAEQTAATIRSSGQEAKAAAIDVGDAMQVQNMVNDVVKQHGRIDYIFNNAGLAIVAAMVDMPLDQWQKIVNVNLWGVIYGTDAAYRVMVKQGFGHIVNVASGAGLIPAPFRVAYTTTKHAVVGLSTALRLEAAPYQVKVSVVCPGTVRTAIFENVPSINFDKQLIEQRLNSQKMTSPAEAARIILDGVDRNQAVIVFPALMKTLWRVYRLAPGLLERTALRKYADDYQKMRVAR